MKLVRNILLVLLIGGGFAAGYGYAHWHPSGAQSATLAKGAPRILYYVDPMHPGYKSDQPGIAPDCGMKLVPVYANGAQGGINGEAASKAPAQDDGSEMPPGTIKVSPEKQQLIGVTYATVESGPGVHTIRAAGKVDYDETRIARVQTRIDGWVDKVFIDFVGKNVVKGQPMLSIYSPELLATEQEFLLALQGRDLMKRSTLGDAIAQSDSLVASARQRLELWQLSGAQIDRIARTGKPLTYVTLYSPIAGFVTARNAFPGQRITPETELYTISDLSRVWIMADVFEYEAPLIRPGAAVRVSLSYLPGHSFPARVDYIQPQVDPATRTLKVRLEADNPGLFLKPNMYVDAEFHVAVPDRLTVPSEAVLDSGLRKTVFVDRGNGFLEPRQVETGERIGARIEIRKGLSAGERIVTSGNFLIDSESQLQASFSGMAGHHHGGEMPATGTHNHESAAPAAGAHSGHPHLIEQQSE